MKTILWRIFKLLMIAVFFSVVFIGGAIVGKATASDEQIEEEAIKWVLMQIVAVCGPGGQREIVINDVSYLCARKDEVTSARAEPQAYTRPI